MSYHSSLLYRFSFAVHGLVLMSLTLMAPLHGATFTVTNTADSGTGSLRAALTSAQATTAADTINFNISPQGSYKINLLSPLPTMGYPVTINGRTQPGYNAATGLPMIEINGASLNTAAIHLILDLRGAGSVVQGLSIQGFLNGASTGIGIGLNGNSNSKVLGCYVGVTPSQQITSDGVGIYVIRSSNCIIGGTNAEDRCVIGGCYTGIQIEDSNDTLVEACSIGISRDGTTASANGTGVFIPGTSLRTIIRNNWISGNNADGIYILGADNTSIIGNKIGSSGDGTYAVGNSGVGIAVATITNISPNNPVTGTLIGGTTSGAGNVISGNYRGIAIAGVNTVGTIQGNKIGTNLLGDGAIGNLDSGVLVTGGATGATSGVIIGGTGNASNLISGNQGPGIWVSEAGTNNTKVEGNKIGTNASGTSAIPNVVGCYLEPVPAPVNPCFTWLSQ